MSSFFHPIRFRLCSDSLYTVVPNLISLSSNSLVVHDFPWLLMLLRQSNPLQR